MRYFLLLFIGLGLLGTTSCGGGSTAPAPLVVTTLADAGAGSLRQVVLDAGPSATIVFDAALAGTIPLASPIVLDQRVRIHGPGLDVITVSGGGATRIFEIADHAIVQLRDLTLADGRATGGAGVYADVYSDVTLLRCAVIKCTAGGGGGERGGGILSLGGKLTCIDCQFERCSARQGGAIDCEGGGGAPRLELRGCSFWNNAASIAGPSIPAGGALFLWAVDGFATNSTFSGNLATGLDSTGGAVVCTNGASLVLSHVTITDNTALTRGGGIYLGSEAPGSVLTGFLSIRNSIVAGNHAQEDPDIAPGGSPLASDGYNVVGVDTLIPFVRGSGDLVGMPGVPLDPALDALADNGGLTPTHALRSSSPAVDLVPVAGCVDAHGNPLPSDQRGTTRPQGPACDAGAYER